MKSVLIISLNRTSALLLTWDFLLARRKHIYSFKLKQLFNTRQYCKTAVLKIWECESLDTEYDNRCRGCLSFDPAKDECRFYGLVMPDDIACENYQPAE
jgi:hypothetical protein